MRHELSKAETCGGIRFQTWLVVFALIAMGFIVSFRGRPAVAKRIRTIKPLAAGRIVLHDNSIVGGYERSKI